MTLISVVIPVYNRKEDLKRCLASVKASFDDYEIVAVDDASTDGSFEALQQWKDDHLRVFRNEANKGVNYTRNRGIENASGRYIAFLDSDDAFKPGAMDAIRKAIDDEERDHYLFFVESYQPPSAGSSFETTYKEWISEKIFGDFTHVIRREILLQYPFFEQFRAYENLNWMRIIKATSPQKVIPEVITWVDLERADNLTKSLKLNTKTAISGKFDYKKEFLGMYAADLLRYARELYFKKLRHTTLLGIAADRREELEKLLHALPQVPKWYHWMARFAPAGLVSKMIQIKANR